MRTLQTKRKYLLLLFFFVNFKSKCFGLSQNLCNCYYIHLCCSCGVIFPTSLAQPCQHLQQLHLQLMLQRHFSIDIHFDVLCASCLKVRYVKSSPFIFHVYPHLHLPLRTRWLPDNWQIHRCLLSGLLANPHKLKWLRTALCTLTLSTLNIDHLSALNQFT